MSLSFLANYDFSANDFKPQRLTEFLAFNRHSNIQLNENSVSLLINHPAFCNSTNEVIVT